MTHPYSRQIYLFGGLKLQDERGVRQLQGEKLVSLLAYLILNPRSAQPREMLAQLLWPEARLKRVRPNLSNALYRLRNILGEDWLTIQRESVALKVDPGLWVDTWEFDRLSSSDREQALQQAVDLYTGDLLPELYDDWVLPERELRRNQFLLSLEKLGESYQERGELQAALQTFRRLILTEPLHEPAHLRYLQLLGRLHRFGEAFAHYDYLRQLLLSELGAEPMVQTRQVLRAIEGERALAAAPSDREEQTEFVGRIPERAAALQAVELALQGTGGILVVEGEAGIGKSRFLREVAAGARWRGALVLRGQASETPGASPFSPIAAALAPALTGPHREQLESLLSAETLAALAPLLPSGQPPTSRPITPADPQGRLFFNALDACGEALAQLFKPVLILDDLHWADRSLWEGLRALARGLTQGGALLMLAYRRPQIEATPGWEILQGWEYLGKLKAIALAPLDLEEVSQLVAERIPASPAEVLRLTGGSPLLISQWLAEPTAEQNSPPLSVARRLPGLSPPARAALECAAVLGDPFPYPLWLQASQVNPLTLASLSDELTAKQWLLLSTTGYSFAHGLIRQAIYQEINPARRAEIHSRAARAYQGLEPDNHRARAYHFDQAGLEPEAAQAYRQAGEQDLARFAFHEAQGALDRALALMPPERTPVRIDTALALARACETTGDYERQRLALKEVLIGARRLKDPTPLIRALLLQARAASLDNQFELASANLNEALELARQIQDKVIETETILCMGINAIQDYRSQAAEGYFAQALELAREIHNLSLEGLALKGLGGAARDLGTPHTALNWFEQALAIQVKTGDRPGEAGTRTNLLAVLFDMGAWDRLLATAEEALQMVTQQGNRHSAAFVRHMQSLAALNLGDTPKAHRYIQQAEQEFTALGNHQSAVMARLVSGLVAENEEHDEEAERLYRSALVAAESAGWEVESAFAQHDLGALYLHTGRLTEAIPLLESAHATWTARGETLLRAKSEAMLGLALIEKDERARAEELAQNCLEYFQGDVPTGEQPQAWLWALYRLLIGLNQESAAVEVIQAGYEELQRQASAISDPNLRNRFFYHVPMNRAILRAADKHANRRRVIEVSLAHVDAPLGRTLDKDEFVKVLWTVDAPEDEAFTVKSERRQHQLTRLLQEAERQGAAPTDSDLAKALGVSRRTILRDMQNLAEQFPALTTRKRKKKGQGSR